MKPGSIKIILFALFGFYVIPFFIYDRFFDIAIGSLLDIRKFIDSQSFLFVSNSLLERLTGLFFLLLISLMTMGFIYRIHNLIIPPKKTEIKDTRLMYKYVTFAIFILVSLLLSTVGNFTSISMTHIKSHFLFFECKVEPIDNIASITVEKSVIGYGRSGRLALVYTFHFKNGIDFFAYDNYSAIEEFAKNRQIYIQFIQ